MRLGRFAIAFLAVVLGGCTVSRATDDTAFQSIFPAYKPTLSDKLGQLLSFPDIDAAKFQQGACTAPDDMMDSAYLLSPGSPGASLALDTEKPVTTTTDLRNTPAKQGDLVDSAVVSSGGNVKQGENTTVQTISKPDQSVIHVRKCSLRVIAAAVNLCVHRTASRNVLDKLENYGIDQVIALGGTAAAVAALSHASGKDTTLAVTAASGAAALAGDLQKAVPASTAAQVSPVVAAGLQYLVLDNDNDFAGGVAMGTRAALLFDAAFSACPLNS